MSEERRSAIADQWERLRTAGRPALIPYVTAGYPSAATTVDTLRLLAAAGADFVEVGVPFSDPLADGPTIQHASFEALRGGTTVGRVLDMIRDASLPIPVILFSYLNPLLRYGIERFLDDARGAGVAGVLLTDVPVGSAPDVEAMVAGSGLDRIPLIALTTGRDRLGAAVAGGSGFVYLISRLGVTGGGTTIGPEVRRAVEGIRARTTLPVAIGFGIATGAQAATAAALADGVVVGSAVVRTMGSGLPATSALMAELRAALDGAAVVS